MRPQVTPFRRPAVAALALAIGLSTLNAGAIAEVQGQTRTKRVAILDFDYSAVRSAAAALFGTDIDVGQGISDMVVTALVDDGTYSVIEREMLDSILAEQNLANSSRFNADSAARIGRVLGVDAIITGSVRQFGRDTSSTEIGRAGRAARRFGFGGFDRSETRAIVAVDARIINVETAEILAVAQGKGESSRTSTSILGSGGSGDGSDGGGVNFGSSDFQETILGEAVRLATAQLSAELVAGSDRIALSQTSDRIALSQTVVEGLVAAVDDGIVILNVGSNAGVRVGDRMRIERVTREIRDPVTEELLRRLTAEIGTVELIDVDAVSAIGRILAGTEFRIGDLAKTVTH